MKSEITQEQIQEWKSKHGDIFRFLKIFTDFLIIAVIGDRVEPIVSPL